MSFLVLMIYLGGVNAVEEDKGFWFAVLWPYHLGKYLGRKVIEGGKQ